MTEAPANGAAGLLAALRAGFERDSVAWIGHGGGFVGHGVAHRIDVGTGSDRFDRAIRLVTAALEDRAALRAPLVMDQTEPSDALAVGSFTFDQEQSGSVLLIPEVIVRERDGVKAHHTAGDARRADAATSATEAVGGESTDSRSRRPRFAGSSVPDEAWLEAVQQALSSISSGAVEKVVLARDQHLWSRDDFDIVTVVENLSQRFPTCFTFLVQGLVGASPELLLRRQGRNIESLVLAGTTSRGGTIEQDEQLADVLLNSMKDRDEHALAVRSVRDVLMPICSDLVLSDEPELLRLANVQHLASRVTGTLSSDRHVLELVGLLHPTAAVGGTPRDAAIDIIKRTEGLDRGRYAGPVGWCDVNGDGEWAIALRCAEIDGARARLFAGAGVVAGSIPIDELRETWLKLAAMRGALGAER